MAPTILSLTFATSAGIRQVSRVAKASDPSTLAARANETKTVRLASTLAALGIHLSTQGEDCNGAAGIQGYYDANTKDMVLCVSQKGLGELSEEERDTFRHESIHVAQDCLGGRLGDGVFAPILAPWELAVEVSAAKIDAININDRYRMAGADDATVTVELEAFALAARLDERQVSDLVSDACGLSGSGQ